ncbi:MAG: rRNA maturation RNase YbeY [Clostridiales bacterium]|nr:rRNA maturation RNase YbeY [Clostridiales bacterium]
MNGKKTKWPAVDVDLVAQLVLTGEGIAPEACELSLSYVSEEEIRALNRKYRGKDEATDVLSFPMYEGIEQILAAVFASGAPVLLGDVVVCEQIAKRQAEEFGHSESRELSYLFVHGALHLLGYGHEEEEGKRRMREAEESVLKELKGRFIDA